MRRAGRSISPAGPDSSKRFFQLYSVCLERPTSGAKSPAGRPLRSQVSRINNRCSGVIAAWADGWGLTNRCPLLFRGPARRCLRTSSKGSSRGGSSPTKASSAWGPGGAPAETWSTTVAAVRGGVISAGETTWGWSTAAAGVGSPAPPQTLAASLGLRPRSAASVCSGSDLFQNMPNSFAV